MLSKTWKILTNGIESCMGEGLPPGNRYISPFLITFEDDFSFGPKVGYVGSMERTLSRPLD